MGSMRLGFALLAALASATAFRAAEVEVDVSVAPGLKFDPARFAVAPGDRVSVVFYNGDEMIHNFVITEPGERLKVVTAALALGADGPGRNYVPDMKEILWSTRALNPTSTTTLIFTAPEKEGIYPYVCTFPGHGFLMYGAMYVTRGEMPPIETDPNIPPNLSAAIQPKDGLIKVTDRPVVSRTFLPDCGPAAIAVGLPGGQSYCFDATACRLRYAWKDGFVDNTDQWAGKGYLWGKVVGRIYYRAPAAPWLRLGSQDHIPAARWHGYRLVNGYPEFQYSLDGAEVSELVRPLPAGGGLEVSFEIPSAPGQVFLVFDPEGGATASSSAGKWSGGTLELSHDEARHFTVTLAERPKAEPLGYWSMNDALWSNEVEPEPGVVGRAFTPGGGERRKQVLDTGIKASDLAGGGTLMAWAKVGGGDSKAFAPIFSAGRTLVVQCPVRDNAWHHVVVTFPPGGAESRLFVDGVDKGASGLTLPTAAASFEIGSAGDKYLSGLIDEVRIYDRVLDAAEIEATYRREAIQANLIRP
jgi:plastocyanin